MNNQAFLDTAHRIGRSLCRDAIWSGPVCNWLGWAARHVGTQLVIGKGSQNAAFGQGTAGIALFLARLHSITADPLIKITGLGALQHAIHNADTRNFDFFTGCTGTLYAAVELDALLHAGEFRTHACQGLKRAMDAGTAAGDGMPARLAGSILALIAIHRRHQFKCALEFAAQLGEALASTVTARKQHTEAAQAAMEGSALLELAAETGHGDFRPAGEQALDSVRRTGQEKAFWPSDHLPGFPELYTQTMPLSFLHAQAGRAAGLAPGHADALQYALTVAEATTTSLTRPLLPGDGGYCLAHGVAGKAEVLALAANHGQRKQLSDTAVAAAQTGIIHFAEKKMPWPCAIPANGESPNLMFGLAGIGYFYLRLYDPAGIPSLLV
ncbi:MAG TPA: lanthionine synthetase LanC family protein [Candidatus Limnocylindrales bacterium]|nr:lanthionine synthetase LanC family protein [Candidatus Limnocylindrales bacterium]